MQRNQQLLDNLYCQLMQANSSTYTAGDMCGPPAIDFGYMDPGMLHMATIEK